MRTRYAIQVKLSSSSNEELDLGNGSYEVVNDNMGEGGSYELTLAPNATDVAVPLGAVADAKLLVVVTRSKVITDPMQTVRLRRGTNLGEAIDIVPLPNSKEGLFALTTSGLAAIFLSNLGATAMRVTLHLAGD